MIRGHSGVHRDPPGYEQLQRLFTAVINQAEDDLEHKTKGKPPTGGGLNDADRFFADWRLDLFADLAHVNAAEIRRKALSISKPIT